MKKIQGAVSQIPSGSEINAFTARHRVRSFLLRVTGPKAREENIVTVLKHIVSTTASAIQKIHTFENQADGSGKEVNQIRRSLKNWIAGQIGNKKSVYYQFGTIPAE